MRLRISCLVLIYIGFAPVQGRDEENEMQISKDGKEILTEPSSAVILNVSTIPDSENVQAAIRTFLHEFERQHGASTLRYNLVENALTFESPHYTSGLLQLNFDYMEGEGEYSSSVLLKVPDLGKLHDYAKKMKYYAKEKYMYEEVIPLMYEHTPYENPSPNFYVATESGIVILDNLRRYGFRGKAYDTLVDLATWKAVWKTFAQFHALSTRQLGQISERIDAETVMDRSDSEWTKDIFPPIVEKLQKYVLPSCLPSVVSKFDHLLKNINEAINLGFSPNANGFNVLLHGKAHLSNLLFEGKSDLKVKLVDFQSSRRGSPVIDLMYFTIISVSYQSFDEHRTELFKFYVEEFNNVLKTMGAGEKDVYSLEKMMADFEMHKPFFFFVLCSAAPTLWAGDQKVSSSSGQETALDATLKSDRYISAFNGWTEYF